MLGLIHTSLFVDRNWSYITQNHEKLFNISLCLGDMD